MEGNNYTEKVKGWPAAIKNYVDELKMEMRRVTWPTRKQVQATTAVVVFTVFAFAAYFAVIDQVIYRAINGIFRSFAG